VHTRGAVCPWKVRVLSSRCCCPKGQESANCPLAIGQEAETIPQSGTAREVPIPHDLLVYYPVISTTYEQEYAKRRLLPFGGRWQ